MRNTFDPMTIQEGSEVIAADGSRLGRVTEMGDTYLHVEKGIFFPTDLYIPLSNVSRTSGDEVWLDLNKPEINAREWNEPPTGMNETDLGRNTQTRIPVHEEELAARKTTRKAGEVEVRKRVVQEHRTIDVPVTREEVEVRRVATDRPAKPGEATFQSSGDTVRVPVMEEQVEVTKTPRVKEEVEIDKVARTDTQRVGDTVRREEVEVSGGGRNVRKEDFETS